MKNKQSKNKENDVIFKGRTAVRNFLNHSPFHDEKSLIVQRDIFTNSPFVSSLFSEIVYSKAHSFQDQHDFVNYLSQTGIDRVIFSNPYRNEAVKKLYEFCRNKDIPLLVIERGCLPETVFFDLGGFLLDSPSYNRKAWDVLPTKEQEDQLTHYITTYQQGLPALEAQSEKKNFDKLVEQLKADDKPVVLITLQIPTDVVTRYFAPEGSDYYNFLEFMKDAVSKYGERYTFIYKPHPRTPELKVDGAHDVSDIHIDQAIALADALLTFNSGTGVLAYLHNKPVATFGRAFYGGDGLAKQISTLDDLVMFLENLPLTFDDDKRKRFLIHLLFRQLSDVRFISHPFWKQGMPIAIQYCKARFYSRVTCKTIEIEHPHPNRLLDISWSVFRWLKNRCEERLT